MADLIGGWGFWFDWSIGNAVLGFIVGSLKLYGANIDEGVFDVKHIIIYAVTVVVGSIFAFGIITNIHKNHLWWGIKNLYCSRLGCFCF